MSFFETLQTLGLLKQSPTPPSAPPAGTPQPAAGPAPTPASPYALDPELRKMAMWQSLGNVSQQMLALGQQMPVSQRARMLANADFSGGMAGNMMDALKTQQSLRQASREELEYQRKEEARVAIAEQIKALPPGKLRDAAMYFFTAGDLGKAGELLWTRSKRWDPMTGTEIDVDALGNPIGGASSPDLVNGGPLPVSGGGVPAPASGGGSPAPAGPSSGSAVAPGGTPPMPPADAAPVDQMTVNYRALTRDPTLTPAEARILAGQGSSKEMWDKYAELVKQRQTDANAKATQDQTALSNNRSGADALTDDYAAKTKSYDTIIGAGQRAVQVANDPSLGPAAKLTTLYQYMKALDPDGAVREGDIQMAQQMQALKDQWMQWAQAQIAGGGPVSQNMINDMAREMARLANDAQGRKEKRRIEMVGLGRGRQIPDAMFDPTLADKNQNMPMPIGYNSQGTGIIQPRASQSTADGRTDREDGAASATVPPGTPRVTTIEDYNNLEPGTVYIDPNGKIKVKGGAQ